MPTSTPGRNAHPRATRPPARRHGGSPDPIRQRAPRRPRIAIPHPHPPANLRKARRNATDNPESDAHHICQHDVFQGAAVMTTPTNPLPSESHPPLRPASGWQNRTVGDRFATLLYGLICPLTGLTCRPEIPTSAGVEVYNLLKRVWIPLLIVIVVVIAGLTVSRIRTFFGANDTTGISQRRGRRHQAVQPQGREVRDLRRDGAYADINYLDLDAQPQRVDGAALPWTLTLSTTAPSVFPNIVAQGDGDRISCRITVDDEVKDERTLHRRERPDLLLGEVRMSTPHDATHPPTRSRPARAPARRAISRSGSAGSRCRSSWAGSRIIAVLNIVVPQLEDGRADAVGLDEPRRRAVDDRDEATSATSSTSSTPTAR